MTPWRSVFSVTASRSWCTSLMWDERSEGPPGSTLALTTDFDKDIFLLHFWAEKSYQGTLPSIASASLWMVASSAGGSLLASCSEGGEIILSLLQQERRKSRTYASGLVFAAALEAGGPADSSGGVNANASEGGDGARVGAQRASGSGGTIVMSELYRGAIPRMSTDEQPPRLESLHPASSCQRIVWDPAGRYCGRLPHGAPTTGDIVDDSDGGDGGDGGNAKLGMVQRLASGWGCGLVRVHFLVHP